MSFMVEKYDFKNFKKTKKAQDVPLCMGLINQKLLICLPQG